MHHRPHVLGIEGGATRTTVLLADADDTVIEQFEAGPANLRLMPAPDLRNHLRAIRARLPFLPQAIGIGLAGARLDSDLERLRRAVAVVWPEIPCAPTDDLATAMEAVEWPEGCRVQVLVLSGTGSCCLGRSRDGEEAKLGGRGHVLGDRASACHIAQQALRALMAAADSAGDWPQLGAEILRHLQMNEPEDLIDWSLVASKTELASVAIPVFRAAAEREDAIALGVLENAASLLAEDAVNAAKRLEVAEDEPVQFVFNGAVLLRNPGFTEMVSLRIREAFSEALLSPLDRPSVWGAVVLGRGVLGEVVRPGHPSPVVLDPDTLPPAWTPPFPSPTEERNPRSMGFSDLEIAEGIRLMVEEDARIAEAVLAESEAIAWTVRQVVKAFREGGHLVYVGAGTSGRLGVLDASECPPTFRVPPDQVQGIIAGGRTALWSAFEGAEDDAAAGVRAIEHRGISERDVVLGISASGHAPFLWGALQKAKECGATIVLLTCHPGYREHPLPDRVIALDTGPEVLTGSTRLRAGTATKVVLNLVTTLAMTHSGKVLGNLMIDLSPSNAKLRDRAVRIVTELVGCSEEEARSALEVEGWRVREACERLGKRC